MPAIKKVCVLLICAICHLLCAFCDAAFEDVAAAARVAGMGNAFVGMADDVSALFYNPAGISRIRCGELGACYVQLHPGLTYDSSLSDGIIMYAQPLKGDLGAVGAGYTERRISDLYGERTAMITYGREFKRAQPFSIGVSMKYRYKYYKAEYDTTDPSQLDPVFQNGISAQGVSVDIGGLCRFTDDISLGVFLGDVNQPDISLERNDPVPFNLKCGVSFRLGSNKDYVMNADCSYRDGDFKFGLGIENWLQVRANEVELDGMWARTDTIGWRAGFGFGTNNFKAVSAGASYRFGGSDLQVDYAFIYPLGSIKNTWGTHCVSLTMRFKSGG